MAFTDAFSRSQLALVGRAHLLAATCENGACGRQGEVFRQYRIILGALSWFEIAKAELKAMFGARHVGPSHNSRMMWHQKSLKTLHETFRKKETTLIKGGHADSRIIQLPRPTMNSLYVRFRFSIRSGMLLVLACAAVLGLAKWKISRTNMNRKVFTKVWKSHGFAAYDYQWADGEALPFARPSGPVWLRKYLGDDFFHELRIVSLGGSTVHDLSILDPLDRLDELSLALGTFTDSDLVHLEGLRQLRRLRLDKNPITDDGLTHLRGLTNLRQLYLNQTNITDAGLDHLRNLKNLEELTLNKTAVTGPGLEQLTGLPNLRKIFLLDLPLTNAGLKHLGRLSRLEEIHVGTRTKTTPEGLAHLTRMGRLRKLSLGREISGDAGFAYLNGLRALKELSVSGPHVTDEGLAHLGSMTGLEVLELVSTQITDGGLAHLSQLKKLRILRLVDSEISDAGLQHLQQMYQLQELNVVNTKISPDGIAQLQKALPSLIKVSR